MLTGDDAKDAEELRRLIAHEDRIVAETERKLHVAATSRSNYLRLLAETTARMVQNGLT